MQRFLQKMFMKAKTICRGAWKSSKAKSLLSKTVLSHSSAKMAVGKTKGHSMRRTTTSRTAPQNVKAKQPISLMKTKASSVKTASG